jgi:hypothetical protein
VKDLIELVRTFLQGLITWFFAVTSPVGTTNSLLANPPKQRLTSTLLLLLWSLVLSLIVTRPLSHMYGIELGNIDFYGQQIVFTILSFLLSVWTIHLVLRVFGQRSNLAELLSILTGTYLVYWPLYQLIMFPAQADNYRFVSTLKESGTPAGDIGRQLLDRIVHPLNYSSGTDTISQLRQGGMMVKMPYLTVCVNAIVSVVAFATLSLFAEFVTQWYGNDRYRTFLAVSLGLWVYILLAAITIAPLSMITLWAYIK